MRNSLFDLMYKVSICLSISSSSWLFMLKVNPKYLVQEIYSKVSQSSLTFGQYSLLLLGLKTIHTDLIGLNLISFLMLKSRHVRTHLTFVAGQ